MVPSHLPGRHPIQASRLAPLRSSTAQGLDPEGVEALLSVIQQEQQAHPGYLGGKARPSQQLRQSTPPAGLSAEATEGVRQASLALFQRLGLRDYAQFSGWVLPPRPAQDAAAAAAAAAQQEAEQEQQEQRLPGKSFAELAALDAELRAELEAAASSVSAADRAAAVDTTAGAADAASSVDEAAGSEEEEEGVATEEQPEESSSLLDQLLAAELERAEAEAQAEATALAERDRNYGVYNGIAIDGSYRLTSEEAMEAMAPYQRCGGQGGVGSRLTSPPLGWLGSQVPATPRLAACCCCLVCLSSRCVFCILSLSCVHLRSSPAAQQH